MFGDILQWLGVPGKFVLLASFAMAAWHFRHALQAAAVASVVAKAGLAFAGVLVVGISGIIPGFQVHVDLGVLVDLVEDVLTVVGSFV